MGENNGDTYGDAYGEGFYGFVVVPDDYPTIQSAINSGAKGIYVKSGTYLMEETITVPSGVFIFGESSDPNGVVVDFNNENWNIIIGGVGGRVWGLKAINSINQLGAFNFNGAVNCEVKNCHIDKCVKGAMFVGATNCRFVSNLVQKCTEEGVLVDLLSTDNRIWGNKITDGECYGIVLNGAFNKVTENNLSGNAFDGILIKSKMNTVHANTCNENANGIYVAKENGDHNSIMGNICNKNLGYGINVESLENTGNVVVGNICRENNVADIRFVPGNQAGLNDALTIV